MDDAVHVAVAVLQRADGCVLVAERDGARHQGGRLEFPGGKIEPGEAPGDALARELAEELAIEVRASEPLIRVRHRYADRRVELHTRRVTAWNGEPRGAEGQVVAWRPPEVLSAAMFPAANRPILAALQLPACSLVTPPPADTSGAGIRAFAAAVERALAAAPRLVRFRAPGIESGPWARFVEALVPVVAARPGSRLIANAPPEWAERLPGDVGLHLSADDSARLAARPLAADRLLTCACHDAAGIARAESLGADAAYLGSVMTTPTHPGVTTLGWTGFADLAARTTLPLYAIGGLSPEDLAPARDAGAVGVAGIRAFWPGAP